MKTKVKYRPILFSGEMVRAILAGMKTQTRRIMTPQPRSVSVPDLDPMPVIKNRFGEVGERLWVRETFCNQADPITDHILEDKFYYAADGIEVRKLDDHGFTAYTKDGRETSPWRSPIFMPRAASRITLEITGVRVERLNSITRSDAMAEGCQGMAGDGEENCVLPEEEYRDLWNRINGPKSWDANPWVWVLEFKRVEASDGK